MPLLTRGILLAAVLLLAGCASTEPVWRERAQWSLEQLAYETAPELRPEAYRSMLEAFEQGEAVYLKQRDAEQADQLYRLAFQKGQLLKMELDEFRAHQLAEAQRQAEIERQRQAEERKRIEEEAQERKRKEQAARELAAAKAAQAEQNAVALRERPASYSVRRGETLPQIAARPEIYNEAGLWPLIYRANRDQVRDPYQLWPGQVLKIPRSYSREEAVEARRQAGRR
ncbi:LysM peptidoglycan-binding domain-containing protein [Trichlorobacter sp.]|uniref:LysM peptidoglycan-binding domain-containing protein n=1 Tax=Trichlorobacter sp. TaxID=2911007 RepID=UPI002A360B15|nr:LysM peptidoglycan-binding domain-containing protein [Trichlorobacter sp.]MDY0383572.1 LysM peptidoglycan-binding domain-containing protein [Trichlorobacter sp.]